MPTWLNDAVFYQIYPQSFLDTNGDGIGDIPGIIQKLDYIQDLGCNAIWLNPCFDSPFWDAGYDVRDYKKVAPRYGTDKDLYMLFKEMHKRNMHILLDLVPGHTSIDHPWFLEASKHAEPEKPSNLEKPAQNNYSNRYIFTPSVWDLPEGYRWVTGYAQRDGNFMVNFFSTQPALNYGFHRIDDPRWQLPPDHPDCVATKEAMLDIMRYWLDNGADGFRVDMAESLIKNDDERISTCKLWQSVRAILDEEYPEAAMVSEWSHPGRAVNAGGFHMDFYLDHWDNGYHALVRSRKDGKNDCYVSRDGFGDITRFTKDFIPKYESLNKNGYISFITCNHDTPRLTRYLDIDEIKLAYAMIFTLPGVPFLYYGDEIGMRFIEGLPSKEGGYNRTGTRTPMQWSKGKNLGFSDAAPEKLYLPVDSSPDAAATRTVEAQQKDTQSLLSTVKALISMRKSYEDLKADGGFEVIYAVKDDPLFIYRRGQFYIFVNPSKKEIKHPLSDKYFPCNRSALRAVYQIGQFTVKGKDAIISPQSFAAVICADPRHT